MSAVVKNSKKCDHSGLSNMKVIYNAQKISSWRLPYARIYSLVCSFLTQFYVTFVPFKASQHTA